jgi:hypothetical protein
MSDMPPAVERPLTPPGWGGSVAAGWGPNASPAGNGWGTGGSWGVGNADAAGGWDDTVATDGGWGRNTAGGWGVGTVPGGPSSPFIPPPPGATYANSTTQRGRGHVQEHEHYHGNTGECLFIGWS